jgi:hypothetical protein
MRDRVSFSVSAALLPAWSWTVELRGHLCNPLLMFVDCDHTVVWDAPVLGFFATATIVRELCKPYDYRIETEFQLTLPCSSSQFFLSSIRHSTTLRSVRELARSTVTVVTRTNLQRKYVKGQAALSSGWK